MRLALRDEIRSLEGELIEEGGFPVAALMETAGRLAAEDILARLAPPSATARIVCGKGNNGGDGFVIARRLREAGFDVRIALVGRLTDLKGASADFANLYLWLGGVCEEQPDGQLAPARTGELQVDALLGTGLDRVVEGPLAQAVDALNAARRAGCAVYAVDVPSGLDADAGRALGEVVRADATGTFGLGKPGLYVSPGLEYAGHVRVLDIGLPHRSVSKWALTARLLEPAEPLLRMPPRAATSHKGSYGHLIVFAGGPGKSGAADLACRGAVRAGAGLVTLCAPGGARAEWPEVMHDPLERFAAGAWRDDRLDRKSAMLFGPGVGTAAEAGDFLKRVCDAELPLVLDADGLNLLATRPDLLAHRNAATVLTPHPAEAARLLACATADIQADRPGAARRLAGKFRAVAVLKGAGTIVALPDGRYRINTSGTPALAAGGTGDVLAGIIAAFLAGEQTPEEAACRAVYAHGLAGASLGFHAGGARASDVAERLPAVLAEMSA
jgi:ADP-dependent NAD(P)H-hydrate dehydratase / NAD(P)H-hydrate epimerase